MQQDGFDDITQAAGPSDVSQPPSAGNADTPEDITPEPLEVDGEDAVAFIHLPKLRTTQEFIDMLRVASLDDTGMNTEDLYTLRNPEPTLELVDPSPLLHSIRHFINNNKCSRDHFDNLQAIVMLNHPNNDLLSFDQSKWCVRILSGVVSLEHNMCPKSCIAYTGPYKELDKCPKCQ
ncbi:hypothetical protein EI94DRAFT_1593606, partial [Lactarius quietus]